MPEGLNIEYSTDLPGKVQMLWQTKQCLTVTAPYEKLPPEIIGQIILHIVLDDRAIFRPLEDLRNDDPRLQVTQICAVWRRVAFDESQLWDVTINSVSGCFVDRVVAWFQQCSCHKLGLRVSGRNSTLIVPPLTPLSPIIAKVIIPYSRKLGVLSLTANEPLLKYILSQSFENLENLILVLDGPPLCSWNELDFHFETSTPHLRSVRVDMESRPVHGKPFLGLPLSQLTELELYGSILENDLVRALTMCSSLQKCTVQSICVPGRRRSDVLSLQFLNVWISVPHLRYLDIQFSTAVSEGLLLTLDTPNLLSLVTNFNFSSPGCHPFFERLKGLRSVTAIKNIRWRTIDEDFLSSISHLTEVKLASYTFTEPILHKIGTGDLLPCVEQLRLAQNDLQLVVDMLHSRVLNSQVFPERVCKIKSIHIKREDDRVEKHLGLLLSSLRSQGMDISISSRIY